MNSFTSSLVIPRATQARGLLVTHRGQRCGVWQFGARLHRAMVAGGGIDWHYAECADLRDFQTAAAASKPDVVLLNFHPSTMPWAAEGLPSEAAVTFAVFHEASQASVAALGDRPFDVLLCPDPTLLPYDPRALPVPRFIPLRFGDLPPAPEVFTVGSFGFGTPGKGFDKLCALVDAQCIEAHIRINIPPHDNRTMVPPAHVAQIVDACRAAVTRPGISLDITHDFFDEAALLDFLAANTLNAFLYDDAPGRGISSCTDYALAAGRPIAVTRTSMFRHLTGINPSICVEDRRLAAIAATGTKPLQFHCSAYTETVAGAAWNATILDALATHRAARAVPDGRGFNKLLDDRARAAYAGPLEDLRRLVPEMLDRKIERANIQQAFALDAAQRLALRFDAPRILVIGSYEDTTCASLRELGYQLEEVDPQVNGRDLEAFYRAPNAAAAFDIVLCVSVLEHVPDDEAFVRQAAALLAPGGIAIFTVDFSERYPETGLRPTADQRLYTQHDLRTRLMGVLPDCGLIDPPRWSDGAEDFEYEGCHYAFAAWVFRRFPPALARHAELTERQLGGAPWKALATRDRASHEQLAARDRASHEQLAARDRASHEREVIVLRAAHTAEVTTLIARARDDINALQDELAADRASHEREVIALRAARAAQITALSEKLARAESAIDYVTQRKMLERIFFRPDGRPVKPLRRLLFHNSGKPRGIFRTFVLHKNGKPRRAFSCWMKVIASSAKTRRHDQGAGLLPQLGALANVPDDFMRAAHAHADEVVAHLQAELDAAVLQVVEANNRLKVLSSDLEEKLGGVLVDVRDQLVSRTAEQCEARAKALKLVAERACEAERADHYERQLQAVHSHSWKITTPIRAASVFLRRSVVRRLGEREAHLAPSAPAPLDGRQRAAPPVQGEGVQGETLTLGADFGVPEADWTAWLERAAKPSQRPRSPHDWLLVCGARSGDDLQSVSADTGISEMRVLGDSAENGAAALQALIARAAPGDCIAVMRAGDRPGSALRRALATFAQCEADIGVFDTHFVQEGRAYPLLHPGFNPPYLAASDSAASRFLLRAGGAREALSGSLRGDATVALRAVLSQPGVQGLHIAEPAIRTAESRESLADDRLRLIAPRPPAVVPEGFAVTVVICTHSKGHLLRQLLRHLEGCPEIVELVLVSHNVTRPHALDTIRAAEADPRVRVINVDGPFNFARMSNLAARGARGTHLLFLNDDIVPISGDWLGQLLHPFIDKKVGATGALLLYPDESIQHAGMFLGFNNLAGHTLRAARLLDGDYTSMSAAPRAVSCLTGAVLAVERRLFEDLNGFDPMLGTMLQDVDLCLRILRTGRVLLFNPRAVLLHLESTTLRPMLGDREVDRTRAREQEYFRNRWLATVQTDSFHNPAFHAAGDESLHILRSVPGDARR